jgi:hypothetical protein
MPFEVLFCVPQGSVLGPLHFSVFINDLCDIIIYSRYPHFADDIKINRDIKSAEGCSRNWLEHW